MDKKAQAVTAYGTDVFDKGIVWGPKLTFANRRCAAARPPATDCGNTLHQSSDSKASLLPDTTGSHVDSVDYFEEDNCHPVDVILGCKEGPGMGALIIEEEGETEVCLCGREVCL